VRGLNSVGLMRNGFTTEDIDALEEAYKKLFRREKPFALAVAEFETQNGINPHVKYLIEFLRRRDQGRHGRYLESTRAK
jgi:acyl-[acyl carrier protein]--UDP-N-acetylglucosamine O-acyltransferase